MTNDSNKTEKSPSDTLKNTVPKQRNSSAAGKKSQEKTPVSNNTEKKKRVKASVSTNPEKKQVLVHTSSDNDKKQRFLPNNQYFTICIYAFGLIVVGALAVRVIMTPYAVTQGIMRILNVLMPFLFGILFAMILNPIINRIRSIMNKHLKLSKYPRLCSYLPIALAYLLVLGFVLSCIIFVVPQIIVSLTDLVNTLPQLYQMAYDLLDKIQTHFPNSDVTEAKNIVNSFLPDFINYFKNIATVVPAVYAASVSVVKGVLNVLIAIIISAYILTDKKYLKEFVQALLITLVPKKNLTITTEILQECNHIFTNFIVSKALDSLIIGGLCFLSMTIFRMDYALLISAIVGITNMIPYFGPFIGAIPGAFILLMISPWKSVGFLILILILQQFDGLYLGPKIMGESMGIKPLWIIVSITLGGNIGGVFGMFVSVPIAAMLVYLGQRLTDYQMAKRQLEKKKNRNK